MHRPNDQGIIESSSHQRGVISMILAIMMIPAENSTSHHIDAVKEEFKNLIHPTTECVNY